MEDNTFLTPEQLQERKQEVKDEQAKKRLRVLYTTTVKAYYQKIISYQTMENLITNLSQNKLVNFDPQKQIKKILAENPDRIK